MLRGKGHELILRRRCSDVDTENRWSSGGAGPFKDDAFTTEGH